MSMLFTLLSKSGQVRLQKAQMATASSKNRESLIGDIRMTTSTLCWLSVHPDVYYYIPPPVNELMYSYSITGYQLQISCIHHLLHFHPDFWFCTHSNDAPGNRAMENLLDALLQRPGFGTKCMEKEEEDNST